MVSVWASMVPGLMSGKCVGGYSTRTDERWLMNNECGYDVTGTFGVFRMLCMHQ